MQQNSGSTARKPQKIRKCDHCRKLTRANPRLTSEYYVLPEKEVLQLEEAAKRGEINDECEVLCKECRAEVDFDREYEAEERSYLPGHF